MRNIFRPALALAGLLTTASALRPCLASAQTVRTLDIGGPPSDSTARRCSIDSILPGTLAAFNYPAAVHVFGTATIGPSLTVVGAYNVYRGALRIDGTVQGNVIVLNGDARVTRTASVTGDITVIGGHLTIDRGATVSGKPYECDQTASLMRLPSGTIALQPSGSSLEHLASGIALRVGGVRIAPRLGVGTYNRVEGLPALGGARAAWGATTHDSIRVEAYGVVRTARDPSQSRPTFGWHGSGTLIHHGSLPFSVGIEGGETINSTVDRPFSAIESGLSALVLHRDYSDWFLRRGASINASLHPSRELTLTGSFESSRQTTVLAVGAFSVLRGTDPWRPNPLIDDGKYRIVTAQFVFDGRNEISHPVLSWLGSAELHRVSSDDITPVSLPTTIRDALPIHGYGSTELSFDLRAYLRLGPDKRLAFRMLGGGYLTGDPLTIQNRRAIGGADPLAGYDFRAINCDRRRKPDPATPALCDRQMAIQVEYRRALPLEVGTQIGNYRLGIRNPDLVLFADAGSAWLAGDSAGRVPNNRIESLREWRSDVGAGVATSRFGLYLAKSLVDALPVRLILLFNSRL